MRALLKFADVVDRLDERVGQALKWLVLFSSVISAGNALMRYTIHYSSNAWLEIQWYMFGAMFLLPIVFRLGLYRSFRTNRATLHISRGAIHIVGMMLWFVALPLTTLAEITALGFTGPIFVTIGAALFLGEDVRLRRWLAVIVGFIGAMIIIRPGFSAFHLGVICVLVSTPIF